MLMWTLPLLRCAATPVAKVRPLGAAPSFLPRPAPCFLAACVGGAGTFVAALPRVVPYLILPCGTVEGGGVLLGDDPVEPALAEEDGYGEPPYRILDAAIDLGVTPVQEVTLGSSHAQ